MKKTLKMLKSIRADRHVLYCLSQILGSSSSNFMARRKKPECPSHFKKLFLAYLPISIFEEEK